MADLAQFLVHQAQEESARLKSCDAKLKTELFEINERKTAIEAERKAISFAPQRALEFQPKIGAEYQCPRCWVTNKVRSPINFIADATADRGYCDVCGFIYELPLGGAR